MKQWVSRGSGFMIEPPVRPVYTDMLDQWANHNHIEFYAARPLKPNDKAAVETK